MNDLSYSKSAAEIKKEIIKLMEQLWNAKRDAFDPLVDMLVSALASELEKLYDHCQDSEERILKRLTEALLPDDIHLPKPAHAIAQLYPNIAKLDIDVREELSCSTDRLGIQVKDEKVLFSPLLPCQLIQGNIKYIVTDHTFYRKDRDVYDSLTALFHKTQNKTSYISKLMLGIELHESIESLEELWLYFNLEPEENHQGSFESIIFSQILQKAKATLAQKELDINWGLDQHAYFRDRANDKNHAYENEILAYYNLKFCKISPKNQEEEDQITIHSFSLDQLGIFWKTDISKLTALDQADQVLEKAKNKVLWIKLQFERPLRIQNFADRFQCNLNAIPVVNREFVKKNDAQTYLKRQTLNVIELQTDGYFLGVHRVFDNQTNEEFFPQKLALFNQDTPNCYTLRPSGINRLDTRHAWGRFERLVKKLKSENEYKTLWDTLGQEASLGELNHLLDSQTNSPDLNDERERHYLIFNAKAHDGLQLTVLHKSTLGSLANHLPKGSALYPEKASSLLDTDSLYLLTASIGGADPLNEIEYQYKMQASLTQKKIPDQLIKPHARNLISGRASIISESDIVHFCQQFFYPEIIQVTIKKGVFIDPRPGFGATRSINVYITSDSHRQEIFQEISLEYLTKQLNQKSSPLLFIQTYFKSNPKHTNPI